MATGSGTVLVVDDDPGIRDLYRAYLGDEYETRTAADGQEALAVLDDSVDVLVLDRDMPQLRGEEVAQRIEKRDTDCFVVMVSGMEPDFDLIGMPVDQYLVKPISQTELREVVETMQARSECQQELQEFLSLAARKTALESRKDATELANSTQYERLIGRLEAKRATVDEMLDEFETERHEHLWEVTDGGPPGETTIGEGL
ncbi:MAG: response regulator [Haloarculaceae archaeon]